MRCHVKEPVVVKPAEAPQKPSEVPRQRRNRNPRPQQSLKTAPVAIPAELQKSPSAVPGTVPSGKKHVLAPFLPLTRYGCSLFSTRPTRKKCCSTPAMPCALRRTILSVSGSANAGGLKLSLDGKEIAHGGKAGQALRLVLPDTTVDSNSRKS